jgi:AcrR family transcriptional regulator
MGLIDRKHREREKRTNSILEAAENIIASEGFDSLKLTRLANQIELSRGLIYYYFKSEENIIAQLISNKMTELISILDAISPQENGFLEIKTILENVYQFFRKEKNFLNLISYFTSHKLQKIAAKQSLFYEEYEKKRDKLFSICHSAVEKGIKDGSIYSGANSYLIAYTIWASLGSPDFRTF